MSIVGRSRDVEVLRARSGFQACVLMLQSSGQQVTFSLSLISEVYFTHARGFTNMLSGSFRGLAAIAPGLSSHGSGGGCARARARALAWRRGACVRRRSDRSDLSVMLEDGVDLPYFGGFAKRSQKRDNQLESRLERSSSLLRAVLVHLKWLSARIPRTFDVAFSATRPVCWLAKPYKNKRLTKGGTYLRCLNISLADLLVIQNGFGFMASPCLRTQKTSQSKLADT